MCPKTSQTTGVRDDKRVPEDQTVGLCAYGPDDRRLRLAAGGLGGRGALADALATDPDPIASIISFASSIVFVIIVLGASGCEKLQIISLADLLVVG